MLTQVKMTQTLGLRPVSVNRKVYAKYCTHMTIYFGPNVQKDHIHNYGHKGGDAGSFVNLSKGQIRSGPLAEC
jgi:hypothetical protein